MTLKFTENIKSYSATTSYENFIITSLHVFCVVLSKHDSLINTFLKNKHVLFPLLH